MQRARSRLAGHLMEHRFPSLCAKTGFSLFQISGLKTGWARRHSCLCWLKCRNAALFRSRFLELASWAAPIPTPGDRLRAFSIYPLIFEWQQFADAIALGPFARRTG